jgi:hypothetical protein
MVPASDGTSYQEYVLPRRGSLCGLCSMQCGSGGNSSYFNRARIGQSWVCEANLGDPLRKKILGMLHEQF